MFYLSSPIFSPPLTAVLFCCDFPVTLRQPFVRFVLLPFLAEYSKYLRHAHKRLFLPTQTGKLCVGIFGQVQTSVFDLYGLPLLFYASAACSEISDSIPCSMPPEIPFTVLGLEIKIEQDNEQSSSAPFTITEPQVAAMLGYPVPLPMVDPAASAAALAPAPLVEVGYFLQFNNSNDRDSNKKNNDSNSNGENAVPSNVCCSTYIAQNDPTQLRKVKAHFGKYRDACACVAKLELRMLQADAADAE